MAAAIIKYSKRGMLFLFLLLCGAVYSYTACLYVYHPELYQPSHPAGDEPHYLIISQTLVKYHSLDVMQDYRNGDYLAFYPVHIDPHVAQSANGKLIPVHGIGGPILWVIPFALWGRIGAVLFMCFITVLIIYNIYQFLLTMGIRERYVLLVSLGYAIASPLYIYSHLTFIESIAALCCIYSFRKLFQQKLTLWEILISATLLGLLHWIHIRFALLEGVLFVLFACKLYTTYRWKKPGYFLALLLPVLLLFVSFEVYNYVYWGSWNPAINQVAMDNRPFLVTPYRGLLGIAFDQEYGLFLNFPIFFFLLAGILLSLQKKFAFYHFAILLVSAPYLLTVATLPDWTGGWCPPARFILALLPLYAFYLAYALDTLNTLLSTLLFLLAGSYGLAYNILSLQHSFNRKTGQNMALASIPVEQLKQNLTYYLPSLFAHQQKVLFERWIGVYLAVTLLLLFVKFLDVFVKKMHI